MKKSLPGKNRSKDSAPNEVTKDEEKEKPRGEKEGRTDSEVSEQCQNSRVDHRQAMCRALFTEFSL